MIVGPPASLANCAAVGNCAEIVNSTHWHYLADPCGSSYTTQRQQISAEEYDYDTRIASGAWCRVWPDYFTPPDSAIVTVRSVQDPYAVAGSLTNCSFSFPPTAKHVANWGIACIVPGMVISVLAYFCMAGACAMPALSADDFGTGAFTPLTGGTKNGGARYGSTQAVELAAQRAADKRVL